MNVISSRLYCAVGLALAMSLNGLPLAKGEGPYEPQPQSSLQQMLSINWKKGTDLPQGFQDSGVGIVNGTLITSTGFDSGQTDVPKKPDKYPRGFLQKTWGTNLQSIQDPWQTLPDFPGVGRQGSNYASVNDQLFLWGGFNYSAPYTYKDGFYLSKQQNVWHWSAAPALPHGLISSGVATLGSKIYVFGGADYDGAGDGKIYTNTDRNGNVQRLGARLYSLDTNNLGAGWKELAQCPGTPRFTPAMTTLGGKLYVFGGATGNDNSTTKYSTVVDNWTYDPATNAWQRIRDLPVASGNFPTGKISAFDRYILLVGGAQYDQVIGPDGSSQPIYGTPIKHDPGYPYASDMWVYDTKLGKFGTATPMPLNNNVPLTVVEGNHVYMIGGETAGASGFYGAVVEGEAFGHHPDLYLTGTITVVPEPGTVGQLGIGVSGLLLCGRRKCRQNLYCNSQSEKTQP